MATLPTSQHFEWATQGSDLIEDPDEPPETQLYMPIPTKPLPFQRAPIRQQQVASSLLTQAILGQSDEEDGHVFHPSKSYSQRRRSMVSNASIASTADLTSDTGLTSPSRTNTPSPPLPNMSMLHLHGAGEQKSGLFSNFFGSRRVVEEPVQQEAPRKRCIQFACAAKPQAQPQATAAAAPPAPMPKAPVAQDDAPKRTCIKFACTARPSSMHKTSPKPYEPSTPKRSMTHPVPISPRPAPAEAECCTKASLVRPRFIRASSTDLIKDGSQFHEFASGMAREDDWIRQENSTQTKLTISDILVKENLIRRLGAEAEEEAEMEEAEEDEADQDEDDEDDEEADEEELDLDEEDEDEDDDGSAGYHTDEETGFADSEEEDDDDENMMMWTPRVPSVPRQVTPRLARRLSINDQQSDDSIGSRRSRRRVSKARAFGPQTEAPDLPDSTDFVCGTLDEDRPVEDAYLSCLAALKKERFRTIPQDIDPSFPASDLDEEDEEDIYVDASDSDGHAWVQGVMEDLGSETDRARRGRKNDNTTSPRRLRSPPPKRRGSPAPKPRARSPAPKPRARSPRPLFDRQSPRRLRSPAPKAVAIATPIQTPRQGAHANFQLAGRPGLTHTKSLPRPAAMFRHQKQQPPKGSKTSSDTDGHIRTAIDIVKGLEKKRLRRKEKFFQKYCDRARRGQIPERKTMLPGHGAERMRELGLLMAGKKGPDYVLSC
ncbi:hypothetical protein ACQKWADRAFT_294036 [Trichoderma austrokoningii]